MISLFKRSPKFFAFMSFLAILGSAGISAKAANAESFVVDGNQALNTNNNFSKVDGNPRIATWTFNPNDLDQQFDRLQGSLGGNLLMHRSTGKCLNAHYLTNGGAVNVWGCNPGDPDQNFNIISLDNGYSQIQRRGTNLCLDNPLPRTNGGKVHLWECDRNNPNQRWKSSTYVAPPSGTDIAVKPTDTNLRFSRGQQWVTPNGYRFVFQADGNLVLYNPQNRALWATGTNGTTADVFSVQADGNVVLYDRGTPVWATNTSGHPGAYLAIQGDGNVVVYAADGKPLFGIGTEGGKTGTFTAAADWKTPLIVRRARVWVDKAIPYSMYVTANPNGTSANSNAGYRTDCSGFVSMAWGLAANGLSVPNTVALTNYATTLNSKSDLRPGDAINNRQPYKLGHVVLFVRWVDQNQGRFIAYEENGGWGKAVETQLTLVWKTNVGWDIPQYPGHAPWYLERKR